MPDNQGQKFQDYLDKRGLNDTEAAKMLGVSSQQIANYCKTKRFRRSTLTEIQSIFEDFILNNIEDRKRNRFQVTEKHKAAPMSDDHWINPNLSVMENLDKLVKWWENGALTKEEFERLKEKVIPKD